MELFSGLRGRKKILGRAQMNENLGNISTLWYQVFAAMSTLCLQKISESLSFVLCKIMEQILLETMMRHMENREMTGDNQYGFTKGKSCLTNLMAAFGSVTEVVDERRVADVIYLDLCKAFVSVSHNILVSEMERSEFDGWTTQWIRTSWRDGPMQTS